MKQIRLVARQKIIRDVTHQLYDDFGLYCLDGICIGEPREVEEGSDLLTMLEEMKRELIESNPKFQNASFAIRYDDGTELPV